MVWSQFSIKILGLLQFEPAPPFFLFKGGGGLTLPEIPRKEGMEKLLKDMEDPKKGGNSVRKEGCCQSGHFSSWGVANVTTVTFNYILVIVFLFSLNVGVSPCFHCTVLFPVYKVYTSCLHNTVVSSCYRWHTSCLHHAGVTSCFRLQIVSTNSKFPSALRNISSRGYIFL